MMQPKEICTTLSTDLQLSLTKPWGNSPLPLPFGANVLRVQMLRNVIFDQL